MKKLEIKHLATYLPYCLRFMAKGDIWEMNRIDNLDTYTVWACIIWDTKKLAYIPEINHKALYCGHGFQLKEVKPILRPLSDLTKEIEHNGERFVPLKRITKEYYDPDNETIFDNENLFKIVDNKYCYPSNNKRTSHWWLSYNEESISFDNQEVESVLPQYGLLQKLFEYHFDVFGLLEHDLAIDINTLEI